MVVAVVEDKGGVLPLFFPHCGWMTCLDNLRFLSLSVSFINVII